MRNTLLYLLLLLLSYNLHAASGSLSPVLTELDKAIAEKQHYVNQKEEQIAGMKRLLSAEHSPLQRYQLNRAVYKEYGKFSLDSAIRYAQQNVEIAAASREQLLIDGVKLDLVVLYAASGRFREAEQLLSQVNRLLLPEELLPEYYEAYIRFFDYYQGNNPETDFMSEVTVYRDSLLSVLPVGSFRYTINKLQQEITKGGLDKAGTELHSLLANTGKDDPDYPMITYLLGTIYLMQQQTGMAETYYAHSSIADIRQAIKDNASLQKLAVMRYEKGDIDRAYLYAGSAMEDALSCNVHFRTLYLSQFYTIVNAAYREKEAERRNELLFYLAMISLLSLFLILAVIYVSRQIRKVSRIKEELAAMNRKLVELNNDVVRKNEQLNERNAQLSESNHIKEEYIAYFFDLCSAYIRKLEDYRKSLYKKASANQTGELVKMLRSTTLVENELEELYMNFDTIFLNLYPDFVKEFNALLAGDEKIVLKPGELLNTELRIFALVRLGITDSVKIASFLRYSLSTIYNYRTRARSKAGVSRDEFEKRVMRIGNTASGTD